MASKILIGSGILMILASVLGTFWGIYSSFDSLKNNSGAEGIGAVGAGIEFALWSNVLMFAGIVFIVFGGVKLYKETKAKK